jgi:hypothetical protein
MLPGLTVHPTSVAYAHFQTAVAMKSAGSFATDEAVMMSRGWRILISKRDLKLPGQLWIGAVSVKTCLECLRRPKDLPQAVERILDKSCEFIHLVARRF